MRKIIGSVIFALIVTVVVAFAQYLPDIIVTGTSGPWTDSRAYTSLNAAITAIGTDQRNVYIIRQENFAGAIPANVNLHFLGDGSINATGATTINTKSIEGPNDRIFYGASNYDFIRGSILKCAWFEDFDEAILETVDDEVTLVMTRNELAATTQAIGDAVTLKWESSGNSLSINVGIIVSNIKQIEAGDYKIVKGVGRFDFDDGIILKSTWFSQLRVAGKHIDNSEVIMEIRKSETMDYDYTFLIGTNLRFLDGNIITVAVGRTLTINSPENIIAGDRQRILAGAGSTTFTTGGRASMLWVALSDGATDDTTEIQMFADGLNEGSTLFFPKGTSYYLISNTIDLDVAGDITIECENGAEIRQTVTNEDGFNTDQDWITFKNCTMQGLGTYITDSSTVNTQALINTTGEHTAIKDCYLKEPEECGIKVDGPYAIIENCTIEGGPYFANAGAIGADRQHYGIFIVGDGDYAKVKNNFVIPNFNANPGAAIQGIHSGTIAEGLAVTGNYTQDCWNHGIYTITEGSDISGNIVRGCGIKVEMQESGVSTKGNTITHNNVDVDDLASPLQGDIGITLDNAKWSTVSINTILNSQNDGISFGSCDVPFVVSDNTIIGNIIDGVVDGVGADSTGISADNTSITEFSNNIISTNTIKNIGDDIDGSTAGIHINLSNVDIHLGNVISNNTISDSQATAMILNYLTGAIIKGNTAHTLGIGLASAAFEMTDLQRCLVKGNYFYGDANMDYAYRETSSNYNDIIENTFYNLATAAVRTANLGANTNVENNLTGEGNISSYSVAGVRTILVADLWFRTHLRDPNGAARVDTTDTAGNINAELLFNDGAKHEIVYLNLGVAAETITIAGGAGVTVFNSEGAADAVIPIGSLAKLLFVRTAAGAVSLFVTVFEAV